MFFSDGWSLAFVLRSYTFALLLVSYIARIFPFFPLFPLLLVSFVGIVVDVLFELKKSLASIYAQRFLAFRNRW